jgi:glycosyltransferase involved in cell wall biosynthesis
VWFLRDEHGVGIPLFLAAARKGVQAIGRRLRWRRADAELSLDGCRAVLAELDSVGALGSDAARAGRGGDDSRTIGRRLRIAHYITSLNSGGAERQVCNLALAQKQAGHDVRVLVEISPSGRHGHYTPLLEAGGIRPEPIGAVWSEHFPSAWQMHEGAESALALLPADLRDPVMDLASELIVRPADVLHCWLDRPNVQGLIAARVAETPAVLLSVRNMSPEHTPQWLSPWMRPWYRLGSEMAGVGLAANAVAGARDYERWLELPSGRIEVLRNAFVPPPLPTPADLARLRQELGLTGREPVVAGVFRLDPEKRPLFFLELVDRLRRLIPEVRVLLAGWGTLETRVRAEWQRRRLEGVVHLLGQRRDVPAILAVSSIMLLVSESEGTPNAALEAQYMGCVPVLTDVGGSREAVAPDGTGLLFAPNDAEGLVRGAARLLREPERRDAMARRGRAWVQEHFDAGRVYAQTQETYAALLQRATAIRAA